MKHLRSIKRKLVYSCDSNKNYNKKLNEFSKECCTPTKQQIL